MRTVEYPVFIINTGDDNELSVVADAGALGMFVDEFADIIEEWTAWDAKGRRMDLVPSARAGGLLAGENIIESDEVDRRAFAAVEAECARRGRLVQRARSAESLVEYASRVLPELFD